MYLILPELKKVQVSLERLELTDIKMLINLISR